MGTAQKPTITRTQRAVLSRLRDGWVMDRAGRDGMSAVMVRGKSEPEVRVSSATVSKLLSECWITPAHNDVTDYRITGAGRKATGRT